MTALLRGQAVHEVTLRLTLAADTIPAEWDWVTRLDLGGDEAVEVTDWKVVPLDDEPRLVGNGGIVAEVLAMIDANGGRLFPDAAEVDTGLCQTCGLEAYDPDCGCVCECHHTCG